ISQTESEYLSSRDPHHRLTCSGFVMASNTRRGGASNSRVNTISRSEGVVVLKVWLFATLLTAISFLLPFQFVQVVVESVEARLPDVAIPFGPVSHFLQRARFDAARPPLGLPAPGDEAGALEHAQVLRDGGHAHVERLGELGHRAFARGQAGENRPPGWIG